MVLATDIYNGTTPCSLSMESPHYHRYHKQPNLSFFRAFGCATVVLRGRDLVEHTKFAPRGELGVYLSVWCTSHGRRAFIVYSPLTSRVYANVDAQFEETYFAFRTSNQRVYSQSYTPCIQLERLSLYHDIPYPTVASIVERLQSSAVPYTTAWDLHDLLQLPATIEEQQPLDLAVYSGDAESSISGELPSVTTGPVGKSDCALDGFLPSCKVQNTVFVNGPSAPCGTLAPSWRYTGSKTVKQVDNSTLVEYLISSEAKIVLPESYWPKDNVSWTTQCMDHHENKKAKGNHTFKCMLLESKPMYVGAPGGANTYKAELSAWHVRCSRVQCVSRVTDWL